jgi:hydrogenase maturation protein HypF
MKKITERKPEIIACDLHPGYFSTRFAVETEGVKVIPVQHHHAHIVGCMAENRISGKVIGLSMDGTGYGTDGQVWGGEFLVADETSFVRAGHIGYYRLPGSEKAIREPWRIAAGLLCTAYGNAWPDAAASLHLIPYDAGKKDFHQTAALLGRMMADGLNSPWTSSLGRLFDGVAALAGLRGKVSFEGQAAMELEAIAGREGGDVLPYEIKKADDGFILDFSGAVRSIVEMRQRSISKEQIAAAFHATLLCAFSAMAERIRDDSALDRVVLSGGCFQNRRLLEDCINEFTRKGFNVFTHHITPTNDGGLSLGQAVCAANKAITMEV